MEELKGTIFEIIYKNEENGYTVASLETDKSIVTITGSFASDISGKSLRLYGKFVKHPRYGEQFQVEAYDILLPTELDAIENYLASGFIKGIGPSTAKKLVSAFGKESFYIIQHFPERLTEIDGIGPSKAKMISEGFSDQIDVREIMMFLQNNGVSPNYAVKIYKEYGKNTIPVIHENPYRLAEDIFGIGFKFADKIAMSLGIEKTSSYRINSGVKYVLTEGASKGHSYLPMRTLSDLSSKLLESDIETIEMEIRNMAFQNKVFIENINNTECVYYLPYHNAEVNVSNRILELYSEYFDISEDTIDEMICISEEKNNITLTKMQKRAVSEAVKNGVTVITGGPGTGKTTIIKTIIYIFEQLSKKVLLCAPTGRAAKKISETTSREAKTIHRLLEYSHGESDSNLTFNKNEESPLDTDVIIVDEASMIDILLMSNLLKAIRSHTRLVLVGDVDQLPSVGAGNVLKDIIESNVINTIKLDEIFRQSHGSSIIENAHRINHGQNPIFNEKDSDFFFMRRQTNKEIQNLIIELYTERIPKKFNLDPIKDIQILSPMKKGDTGVLDMNAKIQEIINPPSKLKPEKTVGKIIFRLGDKVMQIKNDYQIPWKIQRKNEKPIEGEGIYNGDIGYIIFIDDANQELIVQYDEDKEAVYNFSQLDELMLAYVITVHKSQGSEFPVVIMPATWAPEMLLTRNLLYTAITRAKSLVILAGQEKYIKKMIDNNRIDSRYSSLDIRLNRIKDLF